MGMYLQMDGVDDLVAVPSLSFTDMEMDVSIDKTSSWGKYFSYNYTWFQQNSSTVNDQWDTARILKVQKNGVDQTNLTDFVKLGERATFRVVNTKIETFPSYIFANMGTAHTGGKVYGVRYYNGTTLVAHYDMSTGTVLDRSGNGKHATLTGGTWVEDTTIPTNPEAPLATVKSLDRNVISTKTGVDRATVTFTFDKDVVQWEVRTLGAGNGTGYLADSGGAVTAGTEITAIIDHTEGLSSGENRVNIYGKDSSGIWTPYS